ncbi:MAG TPA: D-aminoacyl-tRNA deacylase, partial [Halanaerobiales bacterium]|nr:D-aminoacyl-tRNA deacylase [Halanaerobiales bacterium]
MRAVIQRVNSASVKVNEKIKGEINSGLLVFLGIGKDDEQEDADYLVNKIIELRIFEDNDGKMNLSAVDLDKGLLIISQFTLYG